MGREGRRPRYLSEIRSMRELQEMRRDLELHERFARRNLEDDVAETFSVENLISMVAPQGSAANRVIGGVGTGFSAIRGIIGLVSSFLDGRSARKKHPVRRRG